MIIDFNKFKSEKMALGCFAVANEFSEVLLKNINEENLTFPEQAFLCDCLLTTGLLLFNKITDNKELKNEFKKMVNITMDDVLK